MADDLTIVAQYAKSNRDTPSEVYNAACRLLDWIADATQLVNDRLYGAESHGDGRTPQTLGTPEGQEVREAQEVRE